MRAAGPTLAPAWRVSLTTAAAEVYTGVLYWTSLAKAYSVSVFLRYPPRIKFTHCQFYLPEIFLYSHEKISGNVRAGLEQRLNFSKTLLWRTGGYYLDHGAEPRGGASARWAALTELRWRYGPWIIIWSEFQMHANEVTLPRGKYARLEP